MGRGCLLIGAGGIDPADENMLYYIDQEITPFNALNFSKQRAYKDIIKIIAIYVL
jgi:hypothetical protein